MLYLHEVHQVVGSEQDEFEAASRDGVKVRDQWESKLRRTSAWSPLT